MIIILYCIQVLHDQSIFFFFGHHTWNPLSRSQQWLCLTFAPIMTPSPNLMLGGWGLFRYISSEEANLNSGSIFSISWRIKWIIMTESVNWKPAIFITEKLGIAVVALSILGPKTWRLYAQKGMPQGRVHINRQKLGASVLQHPKIVASIPEKFYCFVLEEWSQ